MCKNPLAKLGNELSISLKRSLLLTLLLIFESFFFSTTGDRGGRFRVLSSDFWGHSLNHFSESFFGFFEHKGFNCCIWGILVWAFILVSRLLFSCNVWQYSELKNFLLSIWDEDAVKWWQKVLMKMQRRGMNGRVVDVDLNVENF